MRLSELKYEEAREQRLSELKALEVLREKCRNSHDSAKGVPIFKRLKLADPYYLITPESGVLKSKYLIEGLISELRSWKRFPDRSKSVRGYTDHDRALNRDEGEMYLILPFDGAKIGVAGASTFTRSFEHGSKMLGVGKLDNAGLFDWLMSVVTVANQAGANIKVSEPSTLNQLMKAFEKLEILKGPKVKKAIVDLKDADDAGVRRALHLVDRRGTVLEFFDEALDPEANNFDLLTTSSSFPKDREAWTTSKCLAIRVDKYDELYKRGDVK